MMYFEQGSPESRISESELRQSLYSALDKIGARHNVLVLPPDITRVHSRAGALTRFAYEYYGASLGAILPALGTHRPMSDAEIQSMFGSIPRELFRIHNWRTDCKTIGIVPRDFVNEKSGGLVNFDWPAQVNRRIADGGYDLILSIGQVVPHEVAGMANYNKNLFVGTGGQEGIHKSHYLGAAYGMERIMGRASNPVRAVLNYASEHFARHLPVLYVHTVVGRCEDNSLAVKGLFAGDDIECFEKAAALSLEVNFVMLDAPLKKVVVYLDPEEYKSTWLGNKSIYRTRMALADNAELVVLAPGVHIFGEDPQIDLLIRKFGYFGTEKVLAAVKRHEDLAANLSAAAHLIHGSSEGRFEVTYCTEKLSRAEILSVGFRFAPYREMCDRYDPAKLNDGLNRMPDGEEIYYIANPALGLWAHRERFKA